MNLLNIIIDLVKFPSSPRFYRDLRDFYKQENMQNEYLALTHLINQKFKNESTDNTNDCEKQ